MQKLLLLLAFFSLSASATTIYKCEAEGKTTYSEMSCTGGKPVEIRRAPASADVAQAKRQAEKEKKIEKKLEKQQLKREVKEEKARQKEARRLEKAASAKQKKCHQLALRKKWAEEDAAKAGLKSAEKARAHASRAAERFSVECGTN